MSEENVKQHSKVKGLDVSTVTNKETRERLVLLELLERDQDGNVECLAAQTMTPQHAVNIGCLLIQTGANLIDEIAKRESEMDAAAKKSVIHMPPGRSVRLQ